MHLKALPLAILLGTAFPAFADPPIYTISKTIPLGSPDGWDYVTFDALSNRVLVAHSTQIDVVDAVSGKIAGTLEGINGAHGQVVDPDTGKIFADSGKTGTLTMFDAAKMTAEKTIPAGQDADGVIYEPMNHLIVVLDGDANAATLINAHTKSVTATVPLGGSPEFAATDGAGRIYINIASTGEIAQVDATAGRVTARYPLPGCQSPHGLAMDPKTHRLFATCVNAKLLVVDPDNGHVLQILPIGHGSDAAAFDPVRRHVFSSNGEGTLSVLQEAADGSVTPLGEVKTAPGARTMAVDSKTGRVFLVTADVDGVRPAEAGRGQRFAFKPGTVKLLFLDPSQK